MALLGPNGAGKSTLFQILSGLFVPDGGAVRIDGRDIRRDAVPALARLGIVFQQPTLDLDLTVRGNLRFHARLHGLSRRTTAERMTTELDRLDLADRINDAARTLSGGNRRRLELARALLHRPGILLMDEPTVGLDPASRRDLGLHVRGLCAEQGAGRALGDPSGRRGGAGRPGGGVGPWQDPAGGRSGSTGRPDRSGVPWPMPSWP